MKICTNCKIEKSSESFYKSKAHSQDVMCYCKVCFSQKAVNRWLERKRKAISYKGNQCTDCGLHLSTTHYSVFEFHHVDPFRKGHDWTKLRLKSWSAI